MKKRISGCIIGSAAGDSMGGPFEFQQVGLAVEKTGKEWIDSLNPYFTGAGAHGPWQDNAPAGTGTDDVRYNWLFLKLAIKLGRMPNAKELAQWFMEIYEKPEKFFPEYTELTKQQFDIWVGVCEGLLGIESKRYPGISSNALLSRGVAGLNYPTLIGLITLPSAGLLFISETERAYKQTYETDFFDIGYAREATAILAAAVSQAASGKNIEQIIDTVLSINPCHLGGVFEGAFVKTNLEEFLSQLPRNKTDMETAEFMSRKLNSYKVCGPFKTIAVAFGSVLTADADPVRAISIAANIRSVDTEGNLAGFGDTDCYSSVTGALAGAISGVDSLGEEIISAVLQNNKNIYDIDLEKTIEEFIQACL